MKLPFAKYCCLLFPSMLQAASFTAIGFEGQTIGGIPNLPTTGVPTGITGPTFSYDLQTGNNLQSFRNSSAGAVDTDDLGTGTSGSLTTSTPDYYKSADFGWKINGYVSTSLTTPNWGVYQAAATGQGASMGTDYPGASGGRTNELSEAFNVNRFFSPATGNLAAAPGLGDQFLDVHGLGGIGSNPGIYSVEMSLQITATQDTVWDGTLGFGGRDSRSALANSFFRLRDGATVLFSGDTGGVPTEYWTDATTQGALTASNGVVQTDWEYFKFSGISVTAGTTYTLDIIMPDEHNFDWVLGSTYTNLPGAIIPEPSSLAIGAGSLVGLLLRRRRK